MSKIDKIKSRIGRNSYIDRTSVSHASHLDRGMLRRAQSVRSDRKRNIADQFGYPKHITLSDHYNMAYRNGIGYNLCFGVVSDTWRVSPVIYDGKEDAERRENNPTEFEQAVDEHFERLQVWERLKGLDIAQRPMRYGGIMFVTTGEPQGSTALTPLVRLPTIDYLADLRVYHEAQIHVETANQDPMSIDYGRPLTYQIRTNVPGATNEWENHGPQVDESRVYAFGEGATDGSIYGTPALESSYEALMDMAKVRGSSAEGVYQNSSNKYVNTLPDNATIADAEAILESQEDFDNEISRSMVTMGDIKTIQTTMVSDPSNTWNIAFSEACAAHSKPQAVVMGEISGERASTENLKNWNRVVMDRQTDVGNTMIKELINQLVDKFTFPAPTNEINIVWRDLNESTAEQKADLAKKRVETNKLAIDGKMMPIYSTEYIQKEAGAPVEDAIELDDLLETDEDEADESPEMAEE